MHVRWALFAAALLFGFAVAHAFEINWYATAPGTATPAEGGAFSLSGTAGQPVAASPLAGGDFSMTGGFWSPGSGVVVATPPASAPRSVVSFEGAAPNPFNPRTTLRFELPSERDVRLRLFDSAGRFVTELAGGRWGAGRHAVTWDGTDARGRSVASGMYVAVLEAGDERRSQRLILLK